MSLFQQTVLKKQMLASSEKIRGDYKLFAAYFQNPEIQENIRNSKEEQFQEGFLRELFVKILGYTLNPEPNYNLITEKKNETDSKKADGAIIVNGEVKAVIELKDHKTTDLKQVEAQAFGYKNNNRKTTYVIISNFEKLRFYIENTIDFEEFSLFTLTEDDFAVLWICLAYENMANDLPKRLKSESANNEDHITKKLYKDYSSFKQLLFDNIQKNKPAFDKLELFRKTQKLLDRFLFVFFAEDKGLLPPNSMKRIIDQWDKRNDDPLNEYQPLYERFKLYFKYMNEGHKGKAEDIFGYNGGLFKPDEILEAIAIDDDVLKENILKLVIYDFDTEVDVNILGHIFEHSLTEIEILTPVPSPNGEGCPTGRGEVRKRKKDGVFYTPRYITTYIVENTLGKLCIDKKMELKIDESEYITDKKRLKTQTKQLSDKLTAYRDWLLSLTICDPACGSGAFLNAALDFLMAEHRYIDELTAKLFGNAIVFPDIENAILENNLYGVDINEESVEIAKLALWLRTAKPNRKLNSLNNNIKCGNSLITPSSPPSPLQNGEGCPAGRGKEDFGEGTGVRTVEIQLPPQLLAYARDLRKNQTEAEDLLWQLLRNKKFNNLKFRRQHPLTAGFILDFYCAEIKLGIELDGGYHNETEQKEYDEERTKIVNEYGINIIRFKNEDILLDIENVLKKIMIAAAPPSPNWRGVGGEEKAFDWHKEFPQVFEKGGFDVVIGNPPYVLCQPSNTPENILNYYKQFEVASYKIDLFHLFFERGIKLLKSNGKLGYITPNTYLTNKYIKPLRKFILDNTTIEFLVQHEENVFVDASVDVATIILSKHKNSENTITIQKSSNNILEAVKIIKQNQWNNDIDCIFNTKSGYELNIVDTVSLGEICNTYFGIQAFDRKSSISEIKENEQFIEIIDGGDIFPYSYAIPTKYFNYIESNIKSGGDWNVYKQDRIVVRQIGQIPIVGMCKKNILASNTLYSIFPKTTEYHLNYILCLLNSSMIKKYWISKYSDSKQLFPKIKGYQLRELPIKEISLEQQQPFITLADKMLFLNSELQTKRQRFLKRLSDNFTGIKITGILERFDELEFKQFLVELAKQKITLSLKRQDEWEEYFNEYITECTNLVNRINTTDKEIDEMVYELYGLTEEDVRIVEK